MKIFISYSVEDTELVLKIARVLEPHASVTYWQKSHEPGKEVWPTIFRWIDSADLVLAVITDKTVARAMSVGQEIGRARAKNKMILPLIAEGVAANQIGFLSGITYEEISRENPGPALESVKERITKLKMSKKAKNDLMVILLGSLAAIWILSLSE